MRLHYLVWCLIASTAFFLFQNCSSEEEDVSTPSITQSPQEDTSPVQYTLSISAGEGGTVSNQGGTYDEGTQVTVTANPNEGYQFVSWQGNNSTNETLTITVNSNQTIQALFESDIDSDGVIDSLDDFPLNSNLTEDLWGQIVDFEPELFFADDISEFIQQQFRNDLNLGIEEWGNYGPLEYWILGNDIEAANSLAQTYCERRTSRGELFYFEGAQQDGYSLEDLELICATEMMHPHASLDWNNNLSNGGTFFTGNLSNYMGRFENYRSTSDNLPSMNAGVNGHRQWGFHFLIHSYPFQYEENEFNITKEDNSIVVLHEYFHIVNSASVFSKEFIVDETGNSVRPDYGPTSMSEGSANYISNYTIRKLINEGRYIKSSSWNYSLRDEMRNKMTQLKEMLVNCPDFNLSELNYGNICDPYTFGQWGIAYLLNRADNQDIYQEVMFPLINDLGYYGAFEQTFGITFEEFNQEFLEFLELPIEEQLEIIPDI